MQRNVETTPPGEAGGGEGDEGVEAGVEGEGVEVGAEEEGVEGGGEGGVAGEEVRRNWLALQECVLTCHTHTHTHTHTRYRRSVSRQSQVVWQHTRVQRLQNDV